MSMNKLIKQEAKKLRDKEKRKKELNTPITKQQYDTIVSNQFIDGKHVSELDSNILNTFAYNTTINNYNVYTKLRAYVQISLNYVLYSNSNITYYDLDEENDDYDN